MSSVPNSVHKIIQKNRMLQIISSPKLVKLASKNSPQNSPIVGIAPKQPIQ